MFTVVSCAIGNRFSLFCSPDKRETSQTAIPKSSIHAIKSIVLHGRQAKAADSPRRQDPRIITSTDKIVQPSKPLDKKIRQKFTIQILDAINPHRFWFAEYTEFRRLNDLLKKMTTFYDAHHTNYKMNSKHIQKGLHVAVVYYGLWHRSVILELKADHVRVFYIDFGTVEDVPLEQVCYLMEEFITEPSFAQRGVLGFCQPTGGKWDQKVLNYFAKLTGKKAHAKLHHKNPRDKSYVLSILVFDNKNLSDDFIVKNYCIADLKFLTKEKVNHRELDFADYESGKRASYEEIIVDWLPKELRGHFSAAWPDVPKTVVISSSSRNSNKENVASVEVHKRPVRFDTPLRTSHLPSPALGAQELPTKASATASPGLGLLQFTNRIEEPAKAQQVAAHIDPLQSSIKVAHQSSDKKTQQNGLTSDMASDSLNVNEPQQVDPSTKSPKQIHSTNGKQSIRRVADWSWDKFQAGSTKFVYCLTINQHSEIFFVLADEVYELRDYFIGFK